MKRAVLVVLCSFAVACTRVGSGPATPGERQNATTQAHVLRYAQQGEITTLNPMLSSEQQQGYLASMTAAWLCKFDRNNKPVPELETVVPTLRNHGISADGKTISYHLRQGLKWSDGTPFSAADIAFSVKLILDPRTNVVSREGWDLITSVRTPDANTIIFRLKEPYSSFVPTFFCSAGANPSIMPKHVLEHTADINKDPFNNKPIGTGPFRYVSWTRGDRITLEPNPFYFRGAPKLQRIEAKIIPNRDTILTALQTGEVDLWPLAGRAYYPRLAALPKVHTEKHLGFGYGHLDFNTARPLVSDPRVRRALVLGIDRRYLIDKVAHGVGLLQDSPVTPASEYFDRSVGTTPFDPAQAQRLLEAAGWHRGADGIRVRNGVRLSVTFVSNVGSPDTDTQIELIRGWWKQIGVELVRKNYDTALLFALAANGGIIYGGKFDAVFFAWFPGPDEDLYGPFGCKSFPPNGQNVVHYCNPAVEAALLDFKRSYDPARRVRDSHIVQRQLTRDMPTMVNYISEDIFAYNSDLKNFHPNAVTPFDDMMNVDI